MTGEWNFQMRMIMISFCDNLKDYNLKRRFSKHRMKYRIERPIKTFLLTSSVRSKLQFIPPSLHFLSQFIPKRKLVTSYHAAFHKKSHVMPSATAYHESLHTNRFVPVILYQPLLGMKWPLFPFGIKLFKKTWL